MKKFGLLLIVLVGLFFIWRIFVYLFVIGKQAVNEELSLTQVSGENYTFYYPVAWQKGNIPNTELSYHAMNNDGAQTGEVITLEISELGANMTAANESVCQQFAQGIVAGTSGFEGRVVSVVPLNTHSVYEGCKVINEFEVNNVVVLIEVKGIWYKDGHEKKLYVVQGTYSSINDESVMKTVGDAVNQFSLR